MARRLLAVACPLLAAATLAACGGDGDEVPQGSPAARHGEAAVATYRDAERIRARLAATGDLYLVGGHSDARLQLRAGEAVYDRLAGRVAARDSLLDREIRAAFDRAEELVVRPGSINYRQEPTNPARERIGQLSGQLLAGVLQTLVPRAARDDPGLRAQVLLDLGSQIEPIYAAGIRPHRGEAGRLDYQLAFGLLVRSQNLARGVGDQLGGRRDDVLQGLADVRAMAFPLGIVRPPTPAPGAVEDVGEQLMTVRERFGLRPGGS